MSKILKTTTNFKVITFIESFRYKFKMDVKIKGLCSEFIYLKPENHNTLMIPRHKKMHLLIILRKSHFYTVNLPI